MTTVRATEFQLQKSYELIITNEQESYKSSVTGNFLKQTFVS